MKTRLLLVFFPLLLVLSSKSYSQIGVTAYSTFAFGVNTSQDHMISGELKTFANRRVNDIFLELDIFYNFNPRAYHRFSLGAGLLAAPFHEFDELYALTIPLQLEVYPLQEFKRLSIMFELAPEIVFDDDVNARFLWGVRYSFGGG